ncbi:MAG TPA: hypothetical protein VFS30_06785 [Dehalococcoidia bacterium]|nr:hypothetical protein [Dehalococcoidia bacterium]
MNKQTAESQLPESTRKSVPGKPIYLVFGVTFLVSLSVIAPTGLPNRSAFQDGSAASPGLQSDVLGVYALVYPPADAIVRYEEGLVDYDIPFGIGTVSDTSSIRWP